jgi:hypothetical protein
MLENMFLHAWTAKLDYTTNQYTHNLAKQDLATENMCSLCFQDNNTTISTIIFINPFYIYVYFASLSTLCGKKIR